MYGMIHWALTGWLALSAAGPCGPEPVPEEPAPEDSTQDESASAAPAVTYRRDIAPILFANCTECHRPQQAAPFSLMSYADAKKRARMLALVTESRLMPPWPPVEGHGEFIGARHLSEAEIGAIKAWVAEGAPEGDPATPLEVPEYTDGWRLGTPDLVVTMPRGFEVPADGQDIYRIFPMHIKTDKDRWLTALEVRPGSGGALHHLRVGYDTTGETQAYEAMDPEPGFEAMDGSTEARFGLGSYVVGAAPFTWPEGLAQLIPAGADIVLNSHIHPVGKAVTEQTTVGLYFTEQRATRQVLRLSLPTSFGAYSGIDIPAGEQDFRIEDSFVLPVDALGMIVVPHAHYICTEMRLRATLPDGTERSLLYIDDWRFEWQGAFRYVEPVDLPAGTRLHAELVYDNSSSNPANPFDPPIRIKWGMQSTEEMGTIGLALVSKDRADHTKLQNAIRAKSKADSQGKRIKMIASRLRMFDRDGDGRLAVTDLPGSLASWFPRIDRDKDGVVTAAELEAVE